MATQQLQADEGFTPLDSSTDEGFTPADAPEPPRGTPAWIDWRKHKAALLTAQIDAANKPNASSGSVWQDLTGGAGASMLQIPVGGYNLLRRSLPALPALPDYMQAAATAPESGAGKVGELIGDTGTFLIPGIGEESVLSHLPVMGKLGTATARALYRAGGAGGMELVKSGGDVNKAAAAAAGTGLASGAESVLTSKPVVNALTDLWGKTMGVNGEWIRTAATQASQKFRDALRGGISESQIVDDLNAAVKDVMTTRGNQYRAAMNQIDPNIRLNINPVNQEMSAQLKAYGINPLTTGKRAFLGSPIVSEVDQQTIRRAIADVDRWTDYSPKGMDTLKQRLTGYADQVSNQAQPFFYRLADSVKQELNSNVPGYQKLTGDYETASELLQQARKELSAQHANPGTTFTKLTQLFSRNNSFRKVLLDSLDQATGSDLTNTMAGYALRSPVPRGLAGVGLGGLVNSIGAWYHNPEALMAGGGMWAASSPRLAGELMALLSTVRRYGGGKVASAAMRSVPPALTNQMTPPPAGMMPTPP